MEEKNLDNIQNEDVLEEETEALSADEKLFETKRYSVPFEMFENAYTVFQKKYVYPRNYVMCIILVILAIANIVNIAVGNSGTIGYLLVFACLALAAVNVYNPKKIKRNLLVSIKGIENDVYTLDVYSDKMVVGTVIEPAEENSERQPEEYEEVFGDIKTAEDIQSSEIYINNSLRVTERSDFFIVYIKKTMFYIIPKNIFTDEEISRFAMYFVDRIGDKFVCEADK